MQLSTKRLLPRLCAALFLALLLGTVTGCTLFEKPSGILETYFEAQKKQDFETLKNCLTEEDQKLTPDDTWEVLTGLSESFRAINKFVAERTTYKINSVKTKGKEATASVTISAPDYATVLDAVYSEDLSGESELEILRYLQENESLIRTSTHTETINLKKESNGWRIFVNLKKQQEDAKKETERKSALAKEYAPNVQFRNVKIDDLAGYSVEAEIKNLGPRTITAIAVKVVGLDAAGNTVFEQDATSISSEKLPPNHSTDLLCFLSDTPSDWTGKVKFVITELDLE